MNRSGQPSPLKSWLVPLKVVVVSPMPAAGAMSTATMSGSAVPAPAMCPTCLGGGMGDVVAAGEADGGAGDALASGRTLDPGSARRRRLGFGRGGRLRFGRGGRGRRATRHPPPPQVSDTTRPRRRARPACRRPTPRRCRRWPAPGSRCWRWHRRSRAHPTCHRSWPPPRPATGWWLRPSECRPRWADPRHRCARPSAAPSGSRATVHGR